MAKNNLLLIILDSCRYDTFAAAATPNIDRLGSAKQCYSYASWTVPSHHVYLMGVGPHRSPKGVFASEVYKSDFRQWADRLNIPDISFKGFVPRLSLPAFLRSHGYRTNALVSMPVLNQTTLFNNHFDRYQLMKAHNDFSAMIDQLVFDQTQPAFYLLNLGETHYPYTLPGETSSDLPIIHGVHGVFKHMDDLLDHGSAKESVVTSATDESLAADPVATQFFNMDRMLALKEKQRKNIEYLDKLFEKLYEKLPEHTHLIVTSDHGECFGEDGYFGHGPVMHEKVFEIFHVEGRIK